MRLGRMSLAIFLFLGGSLNSVAGQRPIYPDLPSPRLVLVGPTGAGKSSLANAFVGCDPRSDDCLFNVCSSLDSCTKDTTYGMGPWLGTGQNFTVVDTPGFGDSDNQDEELIEEMMDVLANTIHHSDTMLLVLDGRLTRFNDGLQTMLKRMTMMFGEDWWDYVVIGVSFWAYDQASIDARECEPEYPQYCKDEEWYSNEITTQLNEKFNTNKNFTFVFTDSWSQTPGPPGYNTEDPLQQEHWQNETKILWDITIGRDNSFDFMTIMDFMEENARQKAEIKWLNDVITFNITEMNERIAVNEALIFDNTEKSIIMTSDIAANEGQISSNKQKIGVNEGQISSNTQKIGVNEGQISSNTEKIAVNTNQIADLKMAPVGTITAWVMKPNKKSDNYLDLPDGWLRCNGETIPHPSIWAGDTLPNLNGENRFLRGGVDSDMLSMEEDMLQEHKHDLTDPGHIHTYKDSYNSNGSPCSCMGGTDGVKAHSRTTDPTQAGITIEGVSSAYSKGTETRPKNMRVVYIMRVW